MISIIIPVYNTGQSARRLIEKLLQDKVQDIEIICVDDASADDSYDYLCKSFPQEKRLTLLHQVENGGVSKARNRGLEQAIGDLVVFLDSDDEVKDDYLTEMQNAMVDSAVVLASCGIEQRYLKRGANVQKFITAPVERREGEKLKSYALRTMIKDAHLYSSVNKMFRGDIIRQAGLRFREDLDFAEDTTFVLDYLGACAESAEIRFVFRALYIYNYGTKTSVVSESALRWENWKRNFADIQKWAEKGSKKDLRRLYRRFKISHALAVARSAKTWREKTQYLNPCALLFASIVIKLRKY